MSDFVVKIDTAKLSDKQAAQVAGAIQGAVMQELAKLDLTQPRGATGSIMFHPEWRGIWLRSIKDLQRVREAEIPVLVVEQR